LPDDFEVGIVGAGPAGSCCAQVLGEAGVRVALFDHSHPREKPCGGLVEHRVVEEFNIPKQLLENELKWILAERFGLRIKLSLKPSAFLVSRKDFDYYLLQKALTSRSVAFFEERVEQITQENGWLLKTNKDRYIKVKVLIGADGCPSLIRKHVLIPIPLQFLATTVGYNFLCKRKYIERAFLKNTAEAYYSHKFVQRGGFIWIFPKKNTVNVGIGSIETGKELVQSLNRFISLHSAGERLRRLEGQFFAHLIPIVTMENFFDVPCSGRDWALIGDAAGHVNPLNGTGIYYAMKGGMLCGSAFLHGDVRLFDKYWREEYGDELRYGAKTFARFYGSQGFFLWSQYVFSDLLRLPFSY
jgi:geranylgeranyl reductase family protein